MCSKFYGRRRRLTLRIDADLDPSSAGQSVDLVNPAGGGNVVLVCEHASRFIPAEMNNLGLTGPVLESHIAWDPGALAVATAMSQTLNAPLVAQRISRLVYDCNRAPDAPDAIPERSEVHDIPGNQDISADDRNERISTVYAPFRKALADCIDGRIKSGSAPPVIVTIHSFTPQYAGAKRDFDIGILHDADSRLADAMLELAAADTTCSTLRNEPYGPEDGVTHTLIEHALGRGLLNVMIEIRNDLITDAASQAAMAGRLSKWVVTALRNIDDTTDRNQRARSAR